MNGPEDPRTPLAYRSRPSVSPIILNVHFYSRSDGGACPEPSGSATQVVSLDEEGKFLFWSVIDLHDDDDDIFLSYGGRMKLLRVAGVFIHKDVPMNQLEKAWTLPRARYLTNLLASARRMDLTFGRVIQDLASLC